MFKDIYKDKTVLITGHTGFKGSWLTTWLLHLGAKVVGVSNGIPTRPSMHDELKLQEEIEHHIIDIRDLDEFSAIVMKYKPDFLFHLAAQSIVSVSYTDPVNTLSTNIMGTAHVMETLRHCEHDCTAVIITSDKCYDNVEWVWGYKETDSLGGKDIYSGSKGGAELVFKSYFHSFFGDKKTSIRLASARAGNVIGGGDWAKDRIVVDCMKAWSEGRRVEIRSPEATRPWQHVLEPLSGYLTLAMILGINKTLNGESFNFGPRSEQNRTVRELLVDLSNYWDFNSSEDCYKVINNLPFHEASLLKLNCDKALFHLKWQPTLNYHNTIRLVSEWYYEFYKRKSNMYHRTIEQINEYQNLAVKNSAIWAK